ncbi:RAD51-associated protein 1 isoform X2 [Oncorhynchus kisutch]|uniref:RAD51-associated protein 1 isoform X2 n=1 Tax=Oncorhynchus kisutch TaxID=8019 RepID=UPI0012DE42B1|nr:RAD51-associated protein 1-like isoform X2 [Oncorhynchus kisutch]
MARPTRAKNQLNYSDLMELDDDEDFACMKGPSSKKARVLVKEPQRDKGLHQSSKSFELHEVTSERGSNVNPSSQRWAAVKAKDHQRSILKVERISQVESGREDKDYQPTCIPPQSGISPNSTPNSTTKSPGQGLRLGLSRLARVKPLHPTASGN